MRRSFSAAEWTLFAAPFVILVGLVGALKVRSATTRPAPTPRSTWQEPPIVKLNALTFSPDGKIVVTADMEGAVKYWDAADGSNLLAMKMPQFNPRDLTFSPDSQLLVNSSIVDLQIYKSPASSIKVSPPIATTPNTSAFDLKFTADGRRLIGACYEGLTIWQVPSFKLLAQPKTGLFRGQSLAISPDDSKVVMMGSVLPATKREKLKAGHLPNAVGGWDLKRQKRLWLQPVARVGGVAFVANDKIALTDESRVLILNANNGKIERTLKWNLVTEFPVQLKGAPIGAVDRIFYSKPTDSVLGLNWAGVLLAADLSTPAKTDWKKLTTELAGYSTSTFSRMAVSQDGKFLALSPSYGELHVCALRPMIQKKDDALPKLIWGVETKSGNRLQ